MWRGSMYIFDVNIKKSGQEELVWALELNPSGHYMHVRL